VIERMSPQTLRAVVPPQQTLSAELALLIEAPKYRRLLHPKSRFGNKRRH
jgi:hypothetical protein